MNADLKKIVFTLIVATFVGALVSCSFFDSASEKPSLDESKKYGSLIINSSNARAIAIADVKYASVVVSGTGIQAGSEPSASNVSVTGGRGSSSPITNIPVGKNRIVTVQAFDASNTKIDGFYLRAVVDIEAGSNSVTVNWATTALGSVFAKLHEDGVNISAISNSDKNAIKAAIDSSKHASLINVQEIASDYANGSLQSSAQYVLSPASLSFAAVNASGYTITFSDPLSVTKTLSTETSGSVTNIAPGNWTVTVKDGSSIKFSQKLNFISAQTTDLGTIGNPLVNKVIIFVKASAAPTIWAWETSGSEVELTKALDFSWDTQPSMENVPSSYMNNPTGWYMHDITTVSSNGNIKFILNKGSEVNSNKTSTFWYDGSSFHDADPTIISSPSDPGDPGDPGDPNNPGDPGSPGDPGNPTNPPGPAGPPVDLEVYSTNAAGRGVNKTITSFSDWDVSMIIAQGAANDDPRAFRGYHEKAVDLYSLSAAYDDTNLYLMVEMPSIDGRDIISKDWQYALDENLGMGIGINTGKGVIGTGEMDEGKTPWCDDIYYSIQEGIDTLLMFHPAEHGTPGLFRTKSSGLFSYDEEYCLKWTDFGITTAREIGLMSSTMYGRQDNYGLSEAEYLAKTDFEDLLKVKTGVTGYMYQITIPLAALDINKSYIQTTGISLMTFSTFGTSMMDALPWCSSLIDCATDAYSKDDSTSKEKEDFDLYNVPLARVGGN